MNAAEPIAEAIRRALPSLKRGRLRFWGSWFGRPYDNQHEIVGGQAEGDLLTVHFNEGEVLRVWGPRRATIDEHSFRIVGANRVRWEWFCYGRPKIPSNVYFEDFATQGAQIRVETNIDWYVPTFQTDPTLPAVEIL